MVVFFETEALSFRIAAQDGMVDCACLCCAGRAERPEPRGRACIDGIRLLDCARGLDPALTGDKVATVLLVKQNAPRRFVLS